VTGSVGPADRLRVTHAPCPVTESELRVGSWCTAWRGVPYARGGCFQHSSCNIQRPSTTARSWLPVCSHLEGGTRPHKMQQLLACHPPTAADPASHAVANIEESSCKHDASRWLHGKRIYSQQQLQMHVSLARNQPVSAVFKSCTPSGFGLGSSSTVEGCSCDARYGTTGTMAAMGCKHSRSLYDLLPKLAAQQNLSFLLLPSAVC